MKSGGPVLRNAAAICELFKTSWQMVKLLKNGDSEKPLKGPVIPFCAMVEHHPISAKDQSSLHLFGKRVLPCICLRYAFVARGIWKGHILVADIEDFGEHGRVTNLSSKRVNAKEVLTSP